MSLGRLGITNIRNIKTAALELDPGINLFLGANGSGKTSLLESVYFLGSGRTFRSNSVDPLITRGEQECTVFGGLIDANGHRSNIGVRRDREGGRDIRINGASVMRASALARRLPTLVLGPNTVELVNGPPGNRRRFLNWGVFHVEPSFSEDWDQANRCLRQRNELLRKPSTREQELEVWDEQLVGLAERIDAARSRWFEQFSQAFNEVCDALTGLDGVTCRYQRGWDATASLHQVLARQRQADLQRGYTQSGFQRADLQLRVNDAVATSTCSRGELKILAWAMVLAQGAVYRGVAASRLVYLVDDLASELDAGHRDRVCAFLADSGGQVLVTGIEGNQLQATWQGQVPRVFHVEHGRFTLEETVDERR